MVMQPTSGMENHWPGRVLVECEWSLRLVTWWMCSSPILLPVTTMTITDNDRYTVELGDTMSHPYLNYL